jgi:parallel beta-helix repeat protein
MNSRSTSVLVVCAAILFLVPCSSSAQSGDWTVCATEGGRCSFSGQQQVRYGANGSYVFKTLTDGTACSNSVFGDPIYGVVKQCSLWTGTSTGGDTGSTEWSFCAFEGSNCPFSGTREVRYGANGSYVYKTLTDGIACSNAVFGDPIYGVRKQCDTRATTAAAAPSAPSSPPPPSSGYGPQSTVTCPAGAVDIWPGVSIQTMVNTYPGNTTFCIRAGSHSIRSSITPKTGNTFVGEYGAVLDGTGWNASDSTEAAFRAHNQDIDYVTIRNLAIRNMPQRGIHAFYYMSNNWTIEYNEITNTQWGIVFPASSMIRNNRIHHNASGGYLGTYSHQSTIENNEIAYNGTEQKVGESATVTFRNNFVHHNARDGIWLDSNNTNVLIEGNRVEDNTGSGIFTEISSGITIRNNAIRRSGNAAVFVSTSKNAQIYGNTLEDNFRGILYFVNCSSVGGGNIGFDLANNAAYDNSIAVGWQSGAFANGFSWTLCSSAQADSYLNGSKNLTFSRNTYYVPSPAGGQYWLWNGLKYWNQWQALGKDSGGAVYQR